MTRAEYAQHGYAIYHKNRFVDRFRDEPDRARQELMDAIENAPAWVHSKTLNRLRIILDRAG